MQCCLCNARSHPFFSCPDFTGCELCVLPSHGEPLVMPTRRDTTVGDVRAFVAAALGKEDAELNSQKTGKPLCNDPDALLTAIGSGPGDTLAVTVDAARHVAAASARAEVNCSGHSSAGFASGSGVTPPVGSPFMKLRSDGGRWADTASTIGGSFDARVSKPVESPVTKPATASATNRAACRRDTQRDVVEAMRFLLPAAAVKSASEDVEAWQTETDGELDDPQTRTVFIKYIPVHFPFQTLFDLVSRFGTVLKVRTNSRAMLSHPSPSAPRRPEFIYAFVEYLRREAATAAEASLNNFTVSDTHCLRVSMANKSISSHSPDDAVLPVNGGPFSPCKFGSPRRANVEATPKRSSRDHEPSTVPKHATATPERVPEPAATFAVTPSSWSPTAAATLVPDLTTRTPQFSRDGALEESVRRLRDRSTAVATDPSASAQRRFDAERDVARRQVLVYQSNPTESNFALAERATRAAHRVLHHLVEVIEENGLLSTLSPADVEAMTIAGLELQALLLALHTAHGNITESVKLAYTIFHQLYADSELRSSPITVSSAHEYGLGAQIDPTLIVLRFPAARADGILGSAEINAWLQLVLLVESVDPSIGEVFFHRVVARASYDSRILLDRANFERLSRGVLLQNALLPGVSNFPVAFLSGTTRVNACLA